MPYDVPLIISVVIFSFSVLGLMRSVMEKHSPVRHALTMVVAVGVFYYAWQVADGQLGVKSVPDAFFRIVAKIT